MVAVTLDAERMKARTRTVRRVRRRTRIVSIFRPEGMPDDLLPRVRRDALPDHARYPDTGCELARACIACPLPRCQYDEPHSVRRWLAAAPRPGLPRPRRRHPAPPLRPPPPYRLPHLRRAGCPHQPPPRARAPRPAKARFVDTSNVARAEKPARATKKTPPPARASGS